VAQFVDDEAAFSHCSTLVRRLNY